MRFFVLKTIDRHKPGSDVTRIYSENVAARLVDEGYLAVVAAVEAAEPREPDDDEGVTDES
jgi:hypothetical protein